MVSKRLSLFERALIAAFAVVFVLSSCLLFMYFSEYKHGSDVYVDIANDYAQKSPDGGGTQIHGADPILQVDFEALKKVNKDTVGWIYLPDSLLNYPVVQGTDNDFYLGHLFNGEQNKVGSIFMDSKNSNDFTDTNTIIYGHNMADNSMFSVLVEYKTQKFFESNPVFYILREGESFMVEIFSCYVASTDNDSWRVGFGSEQEIEVWLNNALRRSSVETDIEVSAKDRFVTLSTCSYEFDNARYIVVGKIVPNSAG